ncbi:MAG: 3-methyl-2-oxobutanoate hydroxymethyltransferase [bacterium]
MKTWTVPRVRQAKGKQKLACLTAYDYSTARMMDEAGIPLILVGDSLGMTVLGYDTTIPVTMEQMLHHTAAVVRGVQHAMVIADMPFLSYQISVESGISNAGRLIKEAGADAVKIEGGAFRSALIHALIANGIPVVGHIGLTPQSIRELGGYKLQGRTAPAAQQLYADAQALSGAGVFALVLECIPAQLAAEITAAIPVPTIGIGAGPSCDAQVLVSHDMLGLNDQFQPRFVKRYADLAPSMRAAFTAYARDVGDGTFPGPEHVYDSGA